MPKWSIKTSLGSPKQLKQIGLGFQSDLLLKNLKCTKFIVTCRLRIPSDLHEQLTSIVKLTSVSSTIGYGREYVFVFFQRDYVHITVYIILRDDVIMRLYIFTSRLLLFVRDLIFFCSKRF